MNEEYRPDILIVDDVPANLDLLTYILKAGGYRVRPVTSGALALRAAENQPPDLVMLDINMPNMNGFEVCQKLKENPALQPIPVIFISALTEAKDKLKGFEVGGVDYVTKPFNAKEVLARLKAHCELRRVQVELSCKNASLQSAFSELRETQEKLVHAEKMASLGVLTAGLAHEINNPINFVNSGVKGLVKVQNDLNRLFDAYDTLDLSDVAGEVTIERIKSEIDYKESRHALDELTGSILEGVGRTVEIIDGLRHFSRAGGQKKSMTALYECLDSALMILHPRLKGRVLVHRNYDSVPELFCSSSSMIQVFMNILSNAIDAVDEKRGETGGVITIGLSVAMQGERHGVCVAITNNGTAISDDVKDKIFDPFYTTKEIGKGVGLGLSISHGIVRDHGGDIEVVSRDDVGTTFSVWLPYQVDLVMEGGIDE